MDEFSIVLVPMFVLLGVCGIANLCLKNKFGDARKKGLLTMGFAEGFFGAFLTVYLLSIKEEVHMHKYWSDELTDEGSLWVFLLVMSLLLLGCGLVNLFQYATESTADRVRTEMDEKAGQTPKTDEKVPLAVKENKTLDADDGWKCVCCGLANQYFEHRCVQCGTERHETGAKVDDPRQAMIINSQIACPVCGTMQGTFRNACRNCGTSFVSTPVQERYVQMKNREDEGEQRWQCPFCDRINTEEAEYCVFCGVERKTVK